MAAMHGLQYDPETGLFTRIEPVRGHRVGQVAGYLRPDGYIDIRCGGRLRRAHRLAWLFMTGVYPRQEIDHINGDPADNRWCNLRLATSAQNKHNSRVHKDNRTGVKGVTWDKSRNKYMAQICVNRKNKGLGRFVTVAEAAEAYRLASLELHGEYSRTS